MMTCHSSEKLYNVLEGNLYLKVYYFIGTVYEDTKTMSYLDHNVSIKVDDSANIFKVSGQQERHKVVWTLQFWPCLAALSIINVLLQLFHVNRFTDHTKKYIDLISS